MFTGQEPWAPTQWTPPLTGSNPHPLAEAFIKSLKIESDGYRLIRLVEKYYRTLDGQRIVLDEWQRQLIIAVLEKFPAGHPLAGTLRFRQVVISLGRQNGKSLLASIFSLYGLIQHVRGPLVIGVASTREQAEVVYSRTHYVIKNVPALNKTIKPSGTRGLKKRDGSGGYEMRASKGESLQGLPITLGLVDELHIVDPEVWDAIVNGQRAQRNGILIGITTAGDDESELLKRLYKQGREAIEDPISRFGFFLWEAPADSTIDTPGAIEAANPAVACGRIAVDQVRSDVRNLPEVDQQRYCLNQWVSAINSWLPSAAWSQTAAGGVPEGARDLTFTVDRTSGWEHASISVTTKVDGRLYTELVCSIVKPNLDQLVEVCTRLYAKHGGTFAADTYVLGALLKELKNRGIPYWPLSSVEMGSASEMAYAKIVRREVSHAGDDLLKVQVPKGRRKNVGDGWRISRAESATDIDALMSAVMGIYVTEVRPPVVMQLF